MTQQSTEKGREPDAREEGILTDALTVPPVHKGGLERIRAAVEREWTSAVSTTVRVERPIRRKWGWTLAVAAGLAALAVGVLSLKSADESAVIGSLARLNDGGAELRFGFLRHRALAVGDALHVGDTLVTRGQALVTLAGGGTVRIGAGSAVAVMPRGQLSLEKGLIFVDLPPESSSSNPLRVMTRAGAIEHLGTQFEIMSDPQVVRIRVREGRIRVVHGAGVWIADAGTELLNTANDQFSRRPFPTAAPDWLWMASMAPAYAIEGQPLIGFLRWVSRESGRPLNFADTHARDVANATILHGSLHGQAPIDALVTVLATTSLTYELRDDNIWVHSGR